MVAEVLEHPDHRHNQSWLRGMVMPQNHTVQTQPKQRRMKDYAGHRFGRYVVLAEAERTNPKVRRVLCRCDCGAEKTISLCALLKGNSKSCGCLNAESETIGDRARTHGMSGSPEYIAWMNMVRRCTYEDHPYYEGYGGRGITVCPEWLESFEAFYRDMGPRPSPKHSLDREKNHLGYGPENCRWVTQKTQCQNTRRNRYLTHNGETLTVSEWARRIGMHRNVLLSRIDRGWATDIALTTPADRHRSPRCPSPPPTSPTSIPPASSGETSS